MVFVMLAPLGTVPRSSGGQGKRAQTSAQSLKSREIAAERDIDSVRPIDAVPQISIEEAGFSTIRPHIKAGFP
jgi:hypothetical protein